MRVCFLIVWDLCFQKHVFISTRCHVCINGLMNIYVMKDRTAVLSCAHCQCNSKLNIIVRSRIFACFLFLLLMLRKSLCKSCWQTTSCKEDCQHRKMTNSRLPWCHSIRFYFHSWMHLFLIHIRGFFFSLLHPDSNNHVSCFNTHHITNHCYQ